MQNIVLHTRLDAWNKIRNQMLNNERPYVCKPCYDVEDLGVKSYRENYIENFLKENLKKRNYNYVTKN